LEFPGRSERREEKRREDEEKRREDKRREIFFLRFGRFPGIARSSFW
jgi:hypothetical protein